MSRMKNKKNCFALISIILVVALMPAIVFADTTVQTYITGGSYWARYWAVTYGDTAVCVFPIVDTQALHNYGIETTIAMTSTVSHSATASESLTVGATELVTLTASVGVSTTVGYSVASTVSYTIPALTTSGRYRIEMVYPQYHMLQEKRLYDSNGTTIEWSNNISYAPRLDAAYRRCYRYANP